MQTASESISTALATRVVRASSAAGACTVKSAMTDETSSEAEEGVWVDIRQYLSRCHCERSEAISAARPCASEERLLRFARNDAIKRPRAAGPRARVRRRAPSRRTPPPPAG